MSGATPGKVAIVTGGGSGIGAATARRLAADGARVVVAGLGAGQLADVSNEIGAAAVPIEIDITSADAGTRLVEHALETFGRIDILVNAAGVVSTGPAEETALETWRRTIDVNLNGLFAVTQAVGKVMIEQRGGAVVNVASTAGVVAVPSTCAYTASKHGVVGLTRALAVEWARYGIRVNALCPGLTNTEMIREAARESPGLIDERVKNLLLGRLAEPSEQANVIAFLVSDDASYVNGVIAPVDGGNNAMAAGYSSPAVATD